jgi:imidazolonepropionase-like amidohydrolase
MSYLFSLSLFLSLSFTKCNTDTDKHSYILIENVSIISMNPSDKDVTLGSILIKDSIIINIGEKSSFNIPGNTKIINGQGKFVIPGLWDTHVHLYKTTRQSIPSFLKYGITSVRDMGGDVDTLKAIISDIKIGKMDGPRIIFCGPTFENQVWMDWVIKNRNPNDVSDEDYARTRVVLKNKEDAKRLVDSVAALGVDFIKIRNYKDAETYYALAKAVRESGLKFYGHTPNGSFDQIAVAGGGQSSFEHGWYPSLSGLSDSAANKVIAAFKRNNCALVPTIITWAQNGFMSFPKMDSLMNGPVGIRDKEVDNLPPALLREWKIQFEIRKKDTDNVRGWNMNALIAMTNETKRLFKAGVTVMPGSDVTSLLVFPGRSLHEELAYFVELVGMTPREALESATKTPSDFFGFKNSRGTIEKGKLADIILLERNPLVDIHNSTSINTVIKNGEILKF